jgi:hypothetical protein
MKSSSLTALEKAQIQRSMTPEGRQVLQILMTQYQMQRDAALRLMRDGGQLLAVAILTRGRSLMRGSREGLLNEALQKANRQNVGYREALLRLQKSLEEE